ncbi:MAG: hypothetical protein ACOH1Q_01710 [Thiobacillus sp.]
MKYPVTDRIHQVKHEDKTDPVKAPILMGCEFVFIDSVKRAGVKEGHSG